MNEAKRYRLFRIVPPRQNDTGVGALVHMMEAMLGAEPVCFEIVLEAGGKRSFFLRLSEAVPAARCLPFLRGAHPQVSWEEVALDNELAPELDPAYPTPGKLVAQAELRQRNNPACPLRVELDDDGFRAADPIVSFLHAGDELGEGEKLLLQVVAQRPRRDPSERYRAIAAGEMGKPVRESLRAAIPARLAMGLGSAILLALLGALLFHAGSYVKGTLAFAAGAGLAVASVWLFRTSRWILEVDPELVVAKLRYPGYRAQVRITAYGSRPQEYLDSALAVYAQLGTGATNGFMPKSACFDPRLPTLQRQTRRRLLRDDFCWLNSAELALLWHFPQKDVEVGGLERTAFPALLPAGDQALDGDDGFFAGETDHPESRRSIYLPGQLLNEHIAVLGASGMGKSNLLQLIGRWIMESGGQLIAIDPHEELSDYLASAVPEAQREKTVYLKAANRNHPFGLNLVAVAPELAADYADLMVHHSQEAVDRAVGTVLSTMERAQVEAWGQRMRSLAASGTKLMAEVGRATGFDYTLLDLETLLDDLNFVRDLLTVYRRVGEDPMVVGYWHGGWMRATESQRREWAYSTVNRINLLKSGVMGNIVGSRKTTLDIDRILTEGCHLIVNAATGWEENTRILMGMLLDMINLSMRRQPRSSRPRVYVMLDEFQLISAANLQGLVNELRKWGVRFVVGTQGLSSLPDPSVAKVVLNNVQQVFAFSAGPEEQELAAGLLGEAVEPEAIGCLSSFHCYARLRLNGRVQPVFSFAVAEAPRVNRTVAEEILARSQRRWCRPLEEVAAERRIIAEKYTLARYDRAASLSVPSREETSLSAAAWLPQERDPAPRLPQSLTQTKPSRRERAKAGGKKGKETPTGQPLSGDFAYQKSLFEEV
ncbi:MAG: DUF87 domain-containing protein [Chloroflexota bacterium]|nr:MAG: DUF87 domain-containing protein [Chloroflexota bacterium]